MKKILITIIGIAAISCNGGKRACDASGVFEATEVIVSSEANGRIVALDLDEGAVLAAGRQVGQIDTVQLYYTRLQLIESMRAANTRTQDVPTQIAMLTEQIATQNREKQRVESLLAAGAANTKQLDDVTSAIVVLEKQLRAQRSLLESANSGVRGNVAMISAQIAQVADQLAKCRIASPISGVVLSKYAERGELATLGKPLFKVADTENIHLRAYITADQLVRIKLGQKATVTADYGGERSHDYEGVVTWISDRAEFTPKSIQTRNERANLVYAVKIALRNDGYVKIGMYGDAIFH
ncbi:MAG: HlyD family efflux transporter periplasmic adaptor subunit [Rikenellaceae bacterium]|jgi:HlyD family secretion protein|nr:HlyD family efflux transporter periplasmic adaptor subunit [Rikenellaceae bacterium]